MINGHGGNIYALASHLDCSPDEIVDMSSNVNPLGPPPGLILFLKDNIDALTSLPEVDANSVIKVFSKWHKLDSGTVTAGNGSTQLIYTIPRALKTRNALIVGPTYSDYADACIMNNIKPVFYTADEQSEFGCDFKMLSSQLKGIDIVFICNPNNPTGILIPLDDLMECCRANSKINFIIDESYLPFVANSERYSMMHSGLENVIVLTSMSKIFRIPGIRIGFMVAPKDITEKMSKYSLPWSVNSLAQSAVNYLMTNMDTITDFISETVNYVEGERNYFYNKFTDIPEIKLFPSASVYILAKLTGSHTAGAVCDYLAKDRVLIRNCSNFFGLSDRFIRFSFKSHDINMVMAEKLIKIITTGI